MVKCSGCSKETIDFVKFKCPKCEEELQRCTKCRSLSTEYKCKCGFIGP